MKFVSKVICAVALLAVGAFGAPDAAAADASLSKEDEAFWGRFLTDSSSSIPPTPAPQPAPKPCNVEVTLECATPDGTECMDIVPPRNPNSPDCIETICYTIIIDNTGDVCMDITVADFDLNGNFLSLLEQIPVNPLCPGESTTVETCGDVNICTNEEFCATINVEANPPNGDMCQDDDEYKFTPPPPVGTPAPFSPPPTPAPQPGPKPCFVEVDLECATPEGTECMDIVPPNNPNSPDCIQTICYTAVIDNTGDVCMDITVADFDLDGNFLDLLDQIPTNPLCPGETTFVETCGEVDICTNTEFCATINVEANPPNGEMCQDDDQYKFTPPPPLGTPPPTLPPVSPPPSPLPTPPPMVPCDVEVLIECATEDGLPCDEIVNPPIPNEEVCIETICYRVVITNPGDVCMDITVVDLDVNGNLADLVGEVPINPLCPGEETEVVSCGDIDICGGGEFCGTVNVEANPPNGEMCQDEAQDKFSLPVPTPAPTPPPPPPCDIMLETECVLADGPQAGSDCSTPFLGFIECLERPTAATMLYNGGGCEQSDNSQPLKFTCMDMNGGPPLNEGEESYIVVTDIKGNGITYFEGLVAVNELYPLNDAGERFEADMFIMIYTPDQSTLLQMVQYHSSCSQNLELKNRFGASQLVEFMNDLQGLVSCFTLYTLSITINLPIAASGSDQIMLTSLTAMTSFAGMLDLTSQVAGQIIGPGTPGVVVTLEGMIDASVRELYTIIYNIEGTRVSDGAFCSGMEMISAEIGYDPNAPGPAPTTGGGDDGSMKDGGKDKRKD